MTLRTTFVSLISLALFSACAASPAVGSNVRTEDLNAQGHRAEAVEHREAAERHGEQQHLVTNARGPVAPLPHADDAQAHSSEANAHDRAASSLETAYRAACAAVPANEHARCAVEGRAIASVTDVPGGARVVFAPGGPDATATLQRYECTHRYADFAGREALANCLLAVRDITLLTHTQGTSVVLTATTADAPSVDELRRRARVGFSAPTTPR